MADYCSLADAKNFMNVSDASDDSEISRIIADVSLEIDEWLRPFVTVPFTSTPNAVRRVCIRWVAGEYYERRPQRDREGHRWIQQAKDALQTFIGSNYRRGKFSASGGLKG